MVIVVSGQEHEPLALQLLAQQRKQALGGGDRVAHRRKQEVEQVTEKHDLVDVIEVGSE